MVLDTEALDTEHVAIDVGTKVLLRLRAADAAGPM
jgi:hypothetical protein